MLNGNDILTIPAANQDTDLGAPAPLQLPPLAIGALMVRKADLISALRVYVPHLSDIETIDSHRFLLHVGEPAAEEQAR